MRREAESIERKQRIRRVRREIRAVLSRRWGWRVRKKARREATTTTQAAIWLALRGLENVLTVLYRLLCIIIKG